MRRIGKQPRVTHRALVLSVQFHACAFPDQPCPITRRCRSTPASVSCEPESPAREADKHFAHGKVRKWFGGTTNAEVPTLEAGVNGVDVVQAWTRPTSLRIGLPDPGMGGACQSGRLIPLPMEPS